MNACLLTGMTALKKAPARERKIELFSKDCAPRGTYALLVHIRSATALQMSRLGTVHLRPGYYVYVGSALGAGGVPGRVNRHLRPTEEKRPHWHIDSLTELGVIEEVWWAEGGNRQECAWASVLTEAGKLAAAGFGASDCRCAGHLVWLGDAEGVAQGWCALQDLVGSHLQRVRIGEAPTGNDLTKRGMDQ